MRPQQNRSYPSEQHQEHLFQTSIRSSTTHNRLAANVHQPSFQTGPTLIEYSRTHLASMNNSESFSDSGFSSDLESPFEWSAAETPFMDPPAKVTTVDIRGQAYKTPKLLSKQFYLDLTFMEDEELISKYMLVKYTKHARNSAFLNSPRGTGHIKR